MHTASLKLPGNANFTVYTRHCQLQRARHNACALCMWPHGSHLVEVQVACCKIAGSALVGTSM